MKHVLLYILIGISMPLFAQQSDIMDKVPKQMSFELGGRYLHSNTFSNKVVYGYSAMFEYGWQLSGFVKKKSVFITVPVGYAIMPAATGDTNRDMHILSYGWSVRHELTKNKRITPFIGYALLLNQVSFVGIKGLVMGHQTRFEGGVNFNIKKRIIPFAKYEYTYSSYPFLGVKKRSALQYSELKIGIRF